MREAATRTASRTAPRKSWSQALSNMQKSNGCGLPRCLHFVTAIILPPPASYLFYIRQHLIIKPAPRRQEYRQDSFINKGYRPMFHLSCGIAFCMDIRYFLKLKRSFKCDRVIYASSRYRKSSALNSSFAKRAISPSAVSTFSIITGQKKQIPQEPCR